MENAETGNPQPLDPKEERERAMARAAAAPWDVIRQEREGGATYRDLAKKYGISQGVMHRRLKQMNGGVPLGPRIDTDFKVKIPGTNREEALGYVQEAIVIAAAILGDKADAQTIQEVLRDAGTEVPLSALYCRLRRLETHYRVLRSRWGKPPGISGYRRKRHYQVPQPIRNQLKRQGKL